VTEGLRFSGDRGDVDLKSHMADVKQKLFATRRRDQLPADREPIKVAAGYRDRRPASLQRPCSIWLPVKPENCGAMPSVAGARMIDPGRSNSTRFAQKLRAFSCASRQAAALVPRPWAMISRNRGLTGSGKRSPAFQYDRADGLALCLCFASLILTVVTLIWRSSFSSLYMVWPEAVTGNFAASVCAFAGR